MTTEIWLIANIEGEQMRPMKSTKEEIFPTFLRSTSKKKTFSMLLLENFQTNSSKSLNGTRKTWSSATLF